MNQQQGGLETPSQPSTGSPGQSASFETPPPMAQPSSGGQNFQPMGVEPPRGGGKTWILIVILLVLLIAGGLVFASWTGWISLGGLEKYWKKSSETTTTTPATTTTTSSKTKNTTNTNDSTRKADLKNIKDALKKYYQANQSYPVATTSQKTLDPSCVLTILVPNDLAKLPVDPLSPTYYYSYTSDGKTFELTAVLEDKTDPSGIKVNETLYIYKVTDSSTETTSSSTTK